MESNHPSSPLGKPLAGAFIVAVMALIFVILPAEYNIDPSGVGKSLGLTTLSGPSSNTAPSTSSEAVQNSDASEEASSHTIEITIPPGRGVEYKLHMERFQKVTYEWESDSADVYVDLHGEPQGDTTGYFESYSIATTSEMKGSFTAPFAGSHGWYWKNTEKYEVEISLTFHGRYQIEGLKQ